MSAPVNIGIFGPKLSGKTTLAMSLSSQYWQRQKIRSLVLDPHLEAWPEPAVVTDDESKFWPTVWKSQNCLVIVEEAATTINRDNTLIQVFTRLRHCNHKLIVIGHSGMSLLPVMREQIDTIYLFRQPASACKVWAEVMTEDGLHGAKELKQYEFIFHRLYGTPRKMILPPPKKV